MCKWCNYGTPLLFLLRIIMIIQHNLGKGEQNNHLETLRRTIENFPMSSNSHPSCLGGGCIIFFFLFDLVFPPKRAPPDPITDFLGIFLGFSGHHPRQGSRILWILWVLHSLKLTFSPLQMDGWNTIFLLGPGLVSGANMLVSGRVTWLHHPKINMESQNWCFVKRVFSGSMLVSKGPGGVFLSPTSNINAQSCQLITDNST